MKADVSAQILVVDDSQLFADSIARRLRHVGHQVVTCADGAGARGQLGRQAFDVVVLDYHLPDAQGLELLDELLSSAPNAVFLVATGQPEVSVAVEAIRRGAEDYVQKGRDFDECLVRIERAAEIALRKPNRFARKTNLGLLGDSTPMRKLREHVDRLRGGDDRNMLILGETGTGKSKLAQAVHEAHGRGPFVEIDCTTIPATLVESELFGHERGAFSGATAAKRGRIEAAMGGTLFLDEIGELSLEVQAKLLRLIEKKEFSRVGGTHTRALPARIITATHRNLATAVAAGRFRQDLRYRLEVFVLQVPPLRDRGGDVILLASHFAAERARMDGRRTPTLSPDLKQALLRYRFPGNVRELRNMVDQATLLAEGRMELRVEDFPVLLAGPWGGGPSLQAPEALDPLAGENEPDACAAQRAVDEQQSTGTRLAEIRGRRQRDDKQAVIRALKQTGGNVAAAARRLGMSRHALSRRIAKHKLR
ncbi:MAG: sigma-54 dependent transcriptional regulator [Proteobacteria bacterium]|nr:sigma-54 dependent transcriptional regulator [Pseudomonadota bacterium]